MRLRARTTTAADPTVISANSQKTAASDVIPRPSSLPWLREPGGDAHRRGSPQEQAPSQAPAGLAGGGEGGAPGAGAAGGTGAGGAGLGGAAGALGFTIKNIACFFAKGERWWVRSVV